MKHIIKKTISTCLVTLLTFLLAFNAQAQTLGATCNLTVSINGSPVYGSGTVTQPAITIQSGHVLSFNLTWTLTDTRYIIQNGDELIFPIVTLSNPAYLQILPSANPSLKIGGVEVAVGYFEWAGNTLRYRIKFNNSAKNYIIGGGNASGSAQFKINGTESPFDVDFEFIATGRFTPAPTPPPGSGGSSGGSAPISTGTWPEAPEARNEPNIYKGIVSEQQINLTTDTKVKVAGYSEPHYGFTWLIPFYGLQELFENDPARRPTDYVIVEDVISANMRFAGFYRPFANFYERNNVFATSFSEASPSPNFFAVEVGFRPFKMNDGFDYSAARLASDTRDNFNVGGPIMYQTQFSEIPATLSTAAAAEATVRNTPFTYSVIPQTDGRTKLIVNIGKFGTGVDVGEGIKANNLNDEWTIRYRAVRMTEEFLRWYERSQVTPYTYIMNAVDTLESWLVKKSGYSGSAAQTSFNNLKNALPAVLQYGNLAINYGTNPIAETYCFTLNTNGYADIRNFINGLPSSGDDIKSLALGIDRMLIGNGAYHIDNYNARMTYHKNGLYDEAAEKYLRGILFHFPNMKAYFNNKLSLGLNLSTATFEQVVAAVKAALYPGSGGFAAIRADYTYHDRWGLQWSSPNLLSYFPSGTLPSPIYRDPVDNISINAVHLWVRTILIDDSENEFANEVSVSTTDYKINTSRQYKHSYNAGIWGLLPGELGFVHADRYVNEKSAVEWEYNVTAANFAKIVQRITGSKFEVYYASDNVKLKFIYEGLDANGTPVYRRCADNDPNIASAVTQLTTGKDGTFKIKSLIDEPIYIKEIYSDGYYSVAQSGTIDPFVNARGGNPAGVNIAVYSIPSGIALRKFNENKTVPLNGAKFRIYKKNPDNSYSLMPGGFVMRSFISNPSNPPRIVYWNAYWYSPYVTTKDVTTDYRYIMYNGLNPSLVHSALDSDKGFIYIYGLPDGEYKFVEIAAPAGYIFPTPAPELPFTINTTGVAPSAVNNFTNSINYYALPANLLTLTNTKKTAPEIKVLKVGVPDDNVGAAGSPMANIGFKLVKTSNFNNNWGAVPERLTASDGYITWSAANITTIAGSTDFTGTYILVESTPPNGVTPIDPIMFSINADGQVINVQLGANNLQLVSFNNQTGSIEFKVKNIVNPTIFCEVDFELVHFTAKNHNDAIQVTWATKSQFNNETFALHRSFDGENFEKLATITGAGCNSAESLFLDYEFFDDDYEILVYNESKQSYQTEKAAHVYYQLVHGCFYKETSNVLGNTDIPTTFLPVELTRLGAKFITDNTTHIAWETATETSNNYFSLQRSFNGVDFEAIAIIAGAGTSSFAHSYEFFDHTVGNSLIVYYRLVQVDYNGATTTSNVIHAHNEAAGSDFEITKLQNNNGLVSIELLFSSTQQHTITIYSHTAAIVHTQTITGTLSETIHIPNLAKGAYIVECVSGNRKQIKKIQM